MGTHQEPVSVIRFARAARPGDARSVRHRSGLGAGQRLTLHLNATGTNGPSHIYLPGTPELGPAGSLALYIPNTTTAAGGSSAPASLADANQILDYVEWGSPGQAARPNFGTSPNCSTPTRTATCGRIKTLHR